MDSNWTFLFQYSLYLQKKNHLTSLWNAHGSVSELFHLSEQTKKQAIL